MDVGKAFAFQFEDKQWVSKLGLGTIISLVPILNFAWSGYMVEILRNVANGVAEPLPTWDDIGKKFNEGLILFGAGLVYALPILIVACLPLSFMVFSALFSGNGNADLQDIGQAIAGAGGVLLYCLLCVFLIYFLVLSVIYPAILVIFSREGTFASCFKFREALNLVSRKSGNFLTAWGISVVSGLVISLGAGTVSAFFSWIPCIGWIVGPIISMGAVVYISTIYSHLFGQFGGEMAK